MQRRYGKWGASLLVLLLLLLGSMAAGIGIGEIRFTFRDLFALWDAGPDDVRLNILWRLRIPRVLLGLAAGGALSLSGVILQGIFRNPLVEPYTLGVSGGASVGVAVAILLAWHTSCGGGMLAVAGFVGALATIVLVYVLGIRRGKIRIQTLLLTGVMISFISSSLLMLLMSVTRSENLHGIIFWIMGSLNETDPFLIGLLLGVSMLVLGLAFFYVPALNAMRLGTERAAQLGFNMNRVIRLLFLCSSLLTGICVSVVGVIGFVGLVVPQLMRFVVGTDNRVLLPAAFLGGGIFLILSDLFSRTVIAPNELPIGVVTGIIGGTAFILVMGSRTGKSLE